MPKLTQTGPDTDMGRLLRSFWQPIAVADSLAPGTATPVRVHERGSDALSRRKRQAYLVGGHCPHRRTLLHTGWVQGEDVRCIYHGWKFDGTGQCTEAPAEGAETASKMSISGYPLHEYAGLIFAYMGEGTPARFRAPAQGRVRTTQPDQSLGASRSGPCNWFQMVENSLDAVHVSFVHLAGKVGPFGEAVTANIPASNIWKQKPASARLQHAAKTTSA